MGHNHNHNIGDIKTLKIVFFLNLFSAVSEFIIGFIINSHAISADGLHDLGDSLILGASIVMTIISRKPPTQKYTFGLRKLLLINVILNTSILIGGSAYVIYHSFLNLNSGAPVLSKPMIIVAIIGLLVNTLAFKLLHKHSDINSRTVALHLLEDVLGWLAVLIGGIIIYYTNWYIIDKILAIAIGIVIFYNSGKNFYDAIQLILLKNPVPSDKLLLEIEKNVKGKITDFHLWSPDGEHLVASMHIKVKDNLTPQEQIKIKRCIREIFKKEVGKHAHITIEIDFPQEDFDKHHHCKDE